MKRQRNTLDIPAGPRGKCSVVPFVLRPARPHLVTSRRDDSAAHKRMDHSVLFVPNLPRNNTTPLPLTNNMPLGANPNLNPQQQQQLQQQQHVGGYEQHLQMGLPLQAQLVQQHIHQQQQQQSLYANQVRVWFEVGTYLHTTIKLSLVRSLPRLI